MNTGEMDALRTKAQQHVKGMSDEELADDLERYTDQETNDYTEVMLAVLTEESEARDGS